MAVTNVIAVCTEAPVVAIPAPVLTHTQAIIVTLRARLDLKGTSVKHTHGRDFSVRGTASPMTRWVIH